MSDAYWLRAWGPPGRPTPRPNCTAIFPGLWVGEYLRVDDVTWLRSELGVQAVLSLQDDGDLAAKDLVWPVLLRAYRSVGIEAHRIPMPDGQAEALLQVLDDAIAWLAEQSRAGRSVYVHCNAGVNRAPTVAIAYLHVVRGMELEEACRHVTSLRTCVPYLSVLRRRYSVSGGGNT